MCFPTLMAAAAHAPTRPTRSWRMRRPSPPRRSDRWRRGARSHGRCPSPRAAPAHGPQTPPPLQQPLSVHTAIDESAAFSFLRAAWRRLFRTLLAVLLFPRDRNAERIVEWLVVDVERVELRDRRGRRHAATRTGTSQGARHDRLYEVAVGCEYHRARRLGEQLVREI